MTGETNYKNIAAILSGLNARIARLKASRGLLRLLAMLIIIYGSLTLLTAFSWPPSSARIAIDMIVLTLSGFAVYRGIVGPLISKGGLLPMARLLERHYGAFQSRLIAALELYDRARENRENYSLELIEKTIDEAGGFIKEIDTEVIIDKKPLLAAAWKTGALAAIALVLMITNGSLFATTWNLYARPLADISRPPEFRLVMEPAGGEFFRNEDLTINVYAEGKSPRAVDLHFKFDDGEWAWESMKQNRDHESRFFDYTLRKIQRSFEVYAVSGKVSTDRARLEVVDPPRLADINIKIDFPDYTGLPDAQGQPNDGNIAALAGSKVSFTATANKPLADAYQLFADSSRIPLAVDDKSITGRFTPAKDDRYSIMMTDRSGFANREPIWYDIQILEDYPPSIQILFPAVDVNLNERMVLPLEASIGDDFGFGKFNIVWWVASDGRESEPSKTEVHIADKSAAEQIVKYVWDISPLDPMPGDLIYYYCEVSDNDTVNGPKWAKSRTFLARLPSLDEILAEVDQSQDFQIEELEKAMNDQKELQKKLDDISREMLKATEVDWEKQQSAREALEKQQDLAERMQKLADEMEDNFERLQENRLMGEEIADKMRQIQELMEEVATPELLEAMEKLREALKNMDPEELREALQDFQLTSQELLENLDRSLSLLKQLAVEQKMDLLTKLAEKVLADQQALNEKTASASDSSSLAGNAGMCRKNSEQFESLQQQFEQLQQMDSEANMVPDKEEQAAEKEIKNPEIPEDFNQMNSQMCQGQSGPCQKTGQKLEDNLKKVLSSLQAAQTAMQEQMKSQITDNLQRIIDDMLYLSSLQEGLIGRTIENEGTAEFLRDFADEQSDIESATSRIVEMISDVSKQTTFVNINLLRLAGELLNNLSEAVRHLDGRSAGEALRTETIAMSNMNTIALILLKAKENAMQSCSGTGMSEMMQKLGAISQKQGGINEQTQSLMPVPGTQLSPSQQNGMRKLAAQQSALRDQLNEMSEGLGERGELLGRLDALSEEMKEVADDLSRAKVDRKTLERQERIFSRLLDAQKSVHRREYSRQRKSETGEDVARRSPAVGEDFEAGGRFSGIAEKALKENYPRKYERLIKAYFKSLLNEGAAIER